MTSLSLLDRNLLALAANNPDLSRRVSAVRVDSDLEFRTTVKGHIVPVVKTGTRSIPLHSMVDPDQEGHKISRMFAGSGYLVFAGIGGGYQIRPFLDRTGVTRLLLIDRSIRNFRTLLEHVDLTRILLDNRVRLFIEKKTEELMQFLISDYLPAIDGDLKIIPLRNAFEYDPTYFQSVMTTLRSALGKISDDYTVQAQFGKRWFVNTLANLSAAQSTTVSIHPAHKIIVTGAGPSLETQVRQLPTLTEDALLIASDTSLPALLNYGIKPDLVVSIDCQQISYHHFMQGIPEDIPLVLDLASPPILTRISANTTFFSSGHPFSQYVTAHWRPFPYIDTSGGNVAQAAVSLALFLGASEIFLLGTDFSFPQGKTYCRGSYIYPLFRSQETRLQSLESLFFSFILKNTNIIKEKIGSTWRYTTRPMIGYKERMEEFLTSSPARIHTLPGLGVPLTISRPAERSRKPISNFLSAGAAGSSWVDFLAAYLKGIQALPEPHPPLNQYFRSLTMEEQILWTTQLPAAATLREKGFDGNREPGSELLNKVRLWSIHIIQRLLDRSQK